MPEGGAADQGDVDVRALYLDLIEACLLNTIYEDPSQDPWSGRVFDPQKRENGIDWPSVAHTMIGRKRMAILKAHGDTGRTVYVADSLEGLPPPDPDRYRRMRTTSTTRSSPSRSHWSRCGRTSRSTGCWTIG